jgi:DNA-binding PadR family transcriptional regulator
MTSSTREPDPRSFLPLTPLVAQVLLALADEPRHGYAIIREVDERTDGLIRLRTGTLYTLLQRLLDQRLIETSEGPRGVQDDDERRRYYRMTSLGRSVLRAETTRLRAVVAVAEATRAVGKG